MKLATGRGMPWLPWLSRRRGAREVWCPLHGAVVVAERPVPQFPVMSADCRMGRAGEKTTFGQDSRTAETGDLGGKTKLSRVDGLVTAGLRSLSGSWKSWCLSRTTRVPQPYSVKLRRFRPRRWSWPLRRRRSWRSSINSGSRRCRSAQGCRSARGRGRGQADAHCSSGGQPEHQGLWHQARGGRVAAEAGKRARSRRMRLGSCSRAVDMYSCAKGQALLGPFGVDGNGVGQESRHVSEHVGNE